jgi:hypothetical protein
MAKRLRLEPCRNDCKAQKASDIVPQMRSGRHTGRMLLLLIAIAVCALGSPKRQVQPHSSLSQPCLHFGQSLALSDFDRDGTTDRARLGVAGLRKNVEIFLSGSGAFSRLHFNTQAEAYGSLFAQDLNNDGDTDLIWTDLVRPDAVVVWLGDGVGQFERVAAHPYAGRFAPGAESITAPVESTQETADANGNACTLDQIADGGCTTFRGSPILVSHQSPVTISSGDRCHPSQRGPPLLLS